MDAIRASFEAQFGTDWSNPLEPTAQEESSSNSEHETAGSGGKLSESDSESESDQESDSDGPITVTHKETGRVLEDKSSRRKYMASGAPKEHVVATQTSKGNDNDEDIANDLELQRLIDESQILAQTQDFSGADLSLADPTEHIGKRRVQILQARLERAGAKAPVQKTPMLIAQGMKAKAKQRKTRQAQFAREGGIITAKEQKVKKKRVHDRGLQINTIGRQTSHGIEVSKRDIAKVQAKSRRKGGRK